MYIFFNCFYILIIWSILFGIYKLFKKEYVLASGNIITPIFLIIFYGFAVMQEPGAKINELTYFFQQLQKANPFAVFAVILFIMFIIILIWDIRTIINNRKRANKNISQK